MKPNLFGYATSELSQDAILCWLLSWADERHESAGPELHELGKALLISLYERTATQPPAAFLSVKPERQVASIDIFCTINDDTALIIEDKVGTKQHSDQLARYRNYALDQGYPPERILALYLQTRDQSDFTEVEDDGFCVYTRQDLLRVLESEAGGIAARKSDILRDFTEYLRAIEDEVQSFATVPPKDWGTNANRWKGFYAALQESLGCGAWDYVANPSGGFWGFWWDFQGDDECGQHLQLEQNRFVFKIRVDDSANRGQLRDSWYERTVEACESLGLKAVRPSRFGNGRYMTVAVLDDDYRIVDGSGRLDLQETIQVLRKAEIALERASF